MPAQGPLLLFDGVCNLCNGWVQWLIRRDPRARIRFASLQSEAGRSALQAAGERPDEMPDSLVLIEGPRVHTRSGAALRVLAGLGWPWLFVSVFLLVPPILRDAVYAAIARRRYAWFGREESCMLPTPALRARFLDADEPRPPLPPKDTSQASDPEPGARLRAWSGRFVVAYLVAYVLPFPLTLLAYVGQVPVIGEVLALPVGWVLALHGLLTEFLVQQLGRGLFGITEVSFAMTGSGDTTAAHLDLLVDLGLALVATLVWGRVAAAGRPMSARTFDGARVLARYWLGTTLLTYGWIKLFPLQFPSPGPDRLLQAYGDSSPMGLAWTFLGASTGYQMLAGAMELLGGYLLLWRRTSLLGALVSLAVMTNVAAINIFYDVPVKLFSLHLVAASLFILTPDLPRVAGVLLLRLATRASAVEDSWPRPRWARVLKLVLVLGVSSAMVLGNLQRYRSQSEVPALEGIFRVESIARGELHDRELEDAERWVRVGLSPPWIGSIQRADGSTVRMRLELDEEAGHLWLYDRGGTRPQDVQFTYRLEDADTLHLEGRFEDADTSVVLRRLEQPIMLRSRGFRWINEYPFNR